MLFLQISFANKNKNIIFDFNYFTTLDLFMTLHYTKLHKNVDVVITRQGIWVFKRALGSIGITKENLLYHHLRNTFRQVRKTCPNSNNR